MKENNSKMDENNNPQTNGLGTTKTNENNQTKPLSVISEEQTEKKVNIISPNSETFKIR